MEKKQSIFSRQGPSKGQVSESRKISGDVNKQWPKNSKRRESSNQSNTKTDLQRSSKPGPAKNRPNVDKRPRARGESCTLPINVPASSTRLEPSTSGSETSDIELYSVSAPGSKKQNLNHLLNFHYIPCDNERTVFASNTNKKVNKRFNGKTPTFNKEQFLQANCQFVVNSSSNVRKCNVSPDALVDWPLIEQIIIQTNEEPQCPICLYPPIAAKLTRCGHAYCWPCILHYLALSDKTWRKCPICYEAIHLGDLKSTSVLQLPKFNVGEEIILNLMRRKQGSFFVEKVSEDGPTWLQANPHISSLSEQKSFVKILMADPSEILTIIEKEAAELEREIEEGPEFIFVQRALHLLEERKQSILKIIDLSKDAEKTVADDLDEIHPGTLKEEGVYSSEKEACVAAASCTPESLTKLLNDTEKYFYFYQSSDGQNIFLHSLNVKMLQRMYGSLEQSPKFLKAKIIQKENYSMNEDLRKRIRYLQHLPLTCQFEVVEINFEPPVISNEVLAQFKDELLTRQKNRLHREREEKKRERQINEMNERQMTKMLFTRVRPDFNSISSDEFATDCAINFGNWEALSDPSELTTIEPVAPAVFDTKTRKSKAAPSFAKMVLSPQKEEFWPSLAARNSGKSEPSASTWAKASSTSSVARNPISELSNLNVCDEDIEEDATHSLHQSLGDAIAVALQQQAIHPPKEPVQNTSTVRNKKGKKNKNTLLFSTGMAFNGN